MCARFSLYATPAQIAELLEIDVPELTPGYNIAPTDTVLGAIERDGERQLREFRWGLIPSWAKDIKVGTKMINARSETIAGKSAFRNAFLRRRCVIPASGFFEWRHDLVEETIPAKNDATPTLFEEHGIARPKTKQKTVKQPFFIGLKSGEPFGFAGLYEYWRSPDGEKVRSCTILTTHPNELVAPLHDRMPVILRKSDLEAWLDCEHSDHVERLLEPLPADQMTAFPVSSAVNDPSNKSSVVIQPAAL